jgi:hypothetical protein
LRQVHARRRPRRGAPRRWLRSDLDDTPTTTDDQLAAWTDTPERFAADLEDAASAVGRLAIVIDSLAELDASATECLAAAIADEGIAHIVLVTRDGDTSQLAVLGTHFSVPAPSEDELAAMLEQPVVDAGYRFTDGLVAQVAKDLAAHASPLAQLAVVGPALWDARDREARTIPRSAYAGARRSPRRLVLAAAGLAASVVTMFAIVTNDGTTQARAATRGPQCIGNFYPKQTISRDFSVKDKQDALTGISSDGKSVLLHRRDCAGFDWTIALVELPGPTTLDLTKLPALAELDPEEGYITMSSDALMVVGTDRTHTKLLSSSRSARHRDDFAPLAPNAFAAITVEAPATIFRPVLSQDGLELFYTVQDPKERLERRLWLRYTRRASTSDPFPPGEPVGDEFHNMPYVTGFSADGLTIFAGETYGLAMFSRNSRDEAFRNPNSPTSPPQVSGFRSRPVGDCTTYVGTCTSGCNGEEVCFYSR